MPRHHRHAGFTIIELVTVMIVIGIMAFVTLPRFTDRTLDEKGFHDAVVAALMHARRSAVASRRYTCATVTPGTGTTATVAIARDTTAPESVGTVACGTATALPAPARGCAATNVVCAPAGVTLGGSNVIFDPLGRAVGSNKAVVGAAVTITVSNQTSITVQPETGYVQ